MSSPNVPMRAVTFWMCRCGVRYKAIHQIDPALGPASTPIECPKCRMHTEVEGDLLSLVREIDDGMWKPVIPPGKV